jgi:hypothetical protein
LGVLSFFFQIVMFFHQSECVKDSKERGLDYSSKLGIFWRLHESGQSKVTGKLGNTALLLQRRKMQTWVGSKAQAGYRAGSAWRVQKGVRLAEHTQYQSMCWCLAYTHSSYGVCQPAVSV